MAHWTVACPAFGTIVVAFGLVFIPVSTLNPLLFLPLIHVLGRRFNGGRNYNVAELSPSAKLKTMPSALVLVANKLY